MRSWPSPVSVLACSLLASSLVACSFDTSGPRGDDLIDANPLDPDAGIDAFFPGDDGGGIARTIRQDTVADFDNGDAVLDNAIVEPWGAIGPAPQVVGALYARGINKSMAVRDAKWEDLVANAEVGHAYLSPSPLVIVNTHPVGIGISTDHDWTILLEGDLWLEAGMHQLNLEVDDQGFIEIAAPGTATYTRIISTDFTRPTTVAFEAKTTGWHPVHIVASQISGGAALILSHVPPTSSDRDLHFVDAYRLRSPGGRATGLLAQGFNNSLMVDASSVTTQINDGIGVDYQAANPSEVGITRADTFSIRWSGQLRVDAAGDYRFTVDSDDGQRLWIDGKRVLDASPHGAFKQTSGPVTLDVGWHDLAVDLREDSGDSHMIVEITAPSGERKRLPAAQLRPSLVRTPRVAGSADNFNKSVPDNSTNGATAALPIDPIADLTIEKVEGDVTISHSKREEIEIAVRAPDGTEAIVIPQGRLTGGSPTTHVNVPFSTDAFDGKPVGGTWTVIVRDRVAMAGGGQFFDTSLAIHAQGGESPVATHAVYASKALDLGKVVGFDRLTYVARTPAGTGVVVKARTCETVDACSAEKWSDALTSGQPPALPLSRRFFQYQVELTTSGDSVPSLGSLELAYRAAP